MANMTLEGKLFSRRVIDNRQVSMTDALKYLLKRPEYRELDVAVGYFYISGILLLKDEFLDFMDNRNGHFRILMGNETNGATVNVLDTSKYQSYDQLIYHKTNNDAKTVSDKDFLGRLAHWIDDGRIEVKVYTGDANYFHAKSYLFASSLDSERGTAIVGSSNFSKAGLEGNTELNVLTEDGFFALHSWYKDLWLSNDETSDFSPELMKIIQANGAKSIRQEFKPVKETYYDFANMYGKPYAELDKNQAWVKGLFAHQRSGIVNVKEKLDSFDTAVLSDGVGLGKTRTAAGVIRLYLASQAVNNILIVADTKLKDQWHDELAAVGVKPSEYSFISRQKLVNIPFDKLKDNNYTLLVIDEAHLGFKNNNTEAYRTVSFMKEHNPQLKGLMLTATPWNNQREDVVNIGSLFLNVDAIPNDRRYKQYFLLSPSRVTNKVVKHLAADDQAFKQFWSDIYLQRTRKTYGGQGAKFPHRNFPSVDIPYEPRKNEIFSNNFDVIADLKFPYQDPIKYIDDSKEELGAKQLKMMLLKRADSSWKAFADSLQHIVDRLERLKDVYLDPMSYLKGQELLKHYKMFLGTAYHITEYEDKNNLDLFQDFYQGEDNSPESDQSLRSRIRKQRYIDNLKAQIDNLKPHKAQNAVNKMIADCNKDLSTLKSLITNLQHAYSKIDEKVDKIIECIDKERSLHHKVILISQFADTVKYYYDKLYSHYNVNGITLPMGMITGAASNDENSVAVKLNDKPSTKKEVLEHFSPISKRRPELIKDKTVIDLVVATDTISTGQNLQDAVTLMNIDLPYNPMTLEQRIGRIDRPLPQGSKQDQIYIYTFPIYNSINSQLKMMKRLGNKMEGVLNDTEFDNVVLPQYEDYLKDITAKRKNAVKSMLDKTDDQLLNHTDFSSEKHSEAYQAANKRMYNFKINQLKPFPNPLIPSYSFSKDSDKKSTSVLVVELEFRDVNNSYLGNERILIDPAKGKELSIVDAEHSLNQEIDKDCHNTSVLSKDMALLSVDEAKENVKKVISRRVDLYNQQHKFFAKNTKTLTNSTAKTASRRLIESAQENEEAVKSRLRSVGIDPMNLGNIAKYISTIDKDDDLFPIVQEIANNPEIFWLNLDDYVKYFSPDVISEAEHVGKNIKKADTRQADMDKTQYKVIVGNIIVKP